MAKDVSPSVRDSLAQALTAISQGMTAPDAAPYMQILGGLHDTLVKIIQQGNGPQPGAPAGPPPGAAMPGAGMGMPPGVPGGQPAGPPPGAPPSYPQMGGQGVIGQPPQIDPNELRALLAQRSGM